MDADAGYRRDVLFTTASQQLANDFITFLRDKNIVFHHYTTTTKSNDLMYIIRILGGSRKSFLEVVNSSHPIKKKELVLTVNRTQPERTLARKEEKSWLGRILGFNQLTLTSSGYFALHYLKDLSVVNAGSLLRFLRNKRQKTVLASQLSLSQSLFSDYENNKRATPFVILDQLLTINNSNQDLMELLETFKLISFKIHKAQATLALRPSSELLDQLQGLQVKKGYFLIVGVPHLSFLDYKNLLQKTFQISFISSSQKRFYNKVLYQFVKTFCTLSTF